jgi:anti-anti-sigma regulatory factor
MCVIIKWSANMRVSLMNSLAGEVILIRADERLDLLAYNGFDEAAALAKNNPASEAIVVDLGGTQELFDSGRAMLLTLRERAGRLKSKIYLTNAIPEIKRKLNQGKFPILFNIGRS